MSDEPHETYTGIITDVFWNPPRYVWFLFGCVLLTLWILSTTAVLHGEEILRFAIWTRAEQSAGKPLEYHLAGALVSIAIQTAGLMACIHSYVTYDR